MKKLLILTSLVLYHAARADSVETNQVTLRLDYVLPLTNSIQLTHITLLNTVSNSQYYIEACPDVSFDRSIYFVQRFGITADGTNYPIGLGFGEFQSLFIRILNR